jgi:hypothetical protein
MKQQYNLIRNNFGPSTKTEFFLNGFWSFCCSWNFPPFMELEDSSIFLSFLLSILLFLISYSHLCLDLRSTLFLWGFMTNIMNVSFLLYEVNAPMSPHFSNICEDCKLCNPMVGNATKRKRKWGDKMEQAYKCLHTGHTMYSNYICMFERKIIRKIYGPVMENNIWRIRYSEEINTLLKGEDIVRSIKSQRIR